VSRHPIFDLKPTAYQQHPLHTGERDWIESNCYIDVYIGLLQGLGVDVYACLGFTLASNFEDDQWTFFKPPLTDLRDLYGLNVQELTLWRPLVEHVEEHLKAGRLVTPEMDAFFLPDVAATDYQQAHVKSTISITHVDRAARVMHYFHNCGHHTLEGDDFDGVFRIGHAPDAEYLPPYCEVMRLDEATVHPTEKLTEIAHGLTAGHLGRRPKLNPMIPYSERVVRDLEWLITQDAAVYHAYVFATLRQCGASFELGALHLRWLGRNGIPGLEASAGHFESISRTAKTLVMKFARITRSKKLRDVSPQLEQMTADWQAGMDALPPELIS
jgi:hypothetical protein